MNDAFCAGWDWFIDRMATKGWCRLDGWGLDVFRGHCPYQDRERFRDWVDGARLCSRAFRPKEAEQHLAA